MAKNSVGTKQLKKNAVTAVKIKNGAITGAKLAAGSVDGDKVADGAVSGGKLANGSVATSKLAAGAVGTDKIANGAITGPKLGAGSVGAANLGQGSVTAGKLDPALFIPHVVARLTATRQVQFPTAGASVVYPFDNPSPVQPAGEDELLVGGVTARFDSGCKTPRSYTVQLEMSGPDGTTGMHEVASAIAADQTGTQDVVSVDFGDGFGTTGITVGLLGMGAPRQHGFQVKLFRASCGTGSTPGATATITSAELDLIGIR